MRCDDVKNLVIGDEVNASVEEHLKECLACRTYATEWRHLRVGFQALATEAAPEPSIGFARRVLRRIQDAPAPADFFELIGRRVVYVAGLVALIFMLALALPSSGPFRGPASAEFTLAQTDSINNPNPVFDDGQTLVQESNPALQNAAGN